MNPTIHDLGIDRWSVAQRLELIEQIWNSLPESVEPDEVPPWHLPLLAERLVEAEANPGVGKPWREVRAEIEARP